MAAALTLPEHPMRKLEMIIFTEYSPCSRRRNRTHAAFSNPVMHWSLLAGDPDANFVPRYSMGTKSPPELGR